MFSSPPSNQERKKSHGTVLEIPNSDTTPRQWTGQFSSQKFSSVNKRRNSPPFPHTTGEKGAFVAPSSSSLHPLVCAFLRQRLFFENDPQFRRLGKKRKKKGKNFFIARYVAVVVVGEMERWTRGKRGEEQQSPISRVACCSGSGYRKKTEKEVKEERKRRNKRESRI